MITGNNIAVDSIPLDRLAGGGITSGRPVRGRIGKTFWVDSTAAQFGDGKADFPCRKIADALSLCQSGRGDVILVAAGHTETLTAAGSITVSKNNVSIIGVGEGANRPSISYSTAVGASLLITGSGVRLQGLHFVLTGIDALTQPIDIQAANCTIEDCSFVGGNGSAQPVRAILTNASASRLLVRGCYYASNTADAGTTAFMTIVGGANIRILNNYIRGAFTAAAGAIENTTTATTNLHIEGNTLMNWATAVTDSTARIISFLSTSTGAIVNNRFQIRDTGASGGGAKPLELATTTLITTSGNYWSAVFGSAGTLL